MTCICGKPDCPLPARRLPDWFWLRRRDIPHHYVCPFLMTLSIYLYRLQGKDAHWSAGKQMPNGEWLTAAIVAIGHSEVSCKFPRRLILWECDFWNGRRGILVQPLWRRLMARRAGAWPRFTE